MPKLTQYSILESTNGVTKEFNHRMWKCETLLIEQATVFDSAEKTVLLPSYLLHRSAVSYRISGGVCPTAAVLLAVAPSSFTAVRLDAWRTRTKTVKSPQVVPVKLNTKFKCAKEKRGWNRLNPRRQSADWTALKLRTRVSQCDCCCDPTIRKWH